MGEIIRRIPITKEERELARDLNGKTGITPGLEGLKATIVRVLGNRIGESQNFVSVRGTEEAVEIYQNTLDSIRYQAVDQRQFGQSITRDSDFTTFSSFHDQTRL